MELFGDEAALVKLVGPDGATLDMLTIPLDDVTVVARSGST